jgi:hypothetical protein
VPRNGKTLCLGVPGRSTFVAVLAAAPGDRREPLVPLLDDGTGDMLPLVGDDVLDGLKSRLLGLGPDRWSVKRQVCRVVAA